MIFIVNLYNEVNQCYLKSVHQTSADFSYPYNKNCETSALNHQICTTRFLSVYSEALLYQNVMIVNVSDHTIVIIEDVLTDVNFFILR